MPIDQPTPNPNPDEHRRGLHIASVRTSDRNPGKSLHIHLLRPRAHEAGALQIYEQELGRNHPRLAARLSAEQAQALVQALQKALAILVEEAIDAPKHPPPKGL
jgi:hypothetical protein